MLTCIRGPHFVVCATGFPKTSECHSKVQFKSADENKTRETKTDKVEISAQPLGETKLKEIDQMSKFRRESCLTDLSERLNRLCSSTKSISANRERIEVMMTEMKYILEQYECRQSFYNSYNKYVEKLSE